jgi:hypothetical protein
MKKLHTIILIATLFFGLISCKTKNESNVKINLKDKEQLAQDSYLYGLQQVIFYGTRFNYTQNEGSDVFEGINRWNIINDGNPIDTKFRAIVTPNATTAYAIGFLDIQAEPVVIEMPEVTDRYFSLQIMSPYGIFNLYAGNQFNGTKARTYLITPEGYKGNIPPNFVATDIISMPSYTLAGIVRYARKDPDSKDDAIYIKKLLSNTTITPLSKWITNGNKGLSREKQEIVKGDYTVYARNKELTKAQVDKQTAEDFFTFLQLILNDQSMILIKDSKLESEMLEQLALINIGKGLSFDWNRLDKDTQEALTKGFENGRKLVKKSGKENMINMNGWGLFPNIGGYRTNWLDRAVAADFGWLGPDRNISHSAGFAFTDSEGEQLNGKYNYTITFDMNNLPPVSEFWELPLYDAAGYFIDNEINRFSINSFQLEAGLLHIENNTLKLYLQHKKPSDSKQLKNWLPTPDGVFRLTPRFYGPKFPLTNGSYKMPKIVRSQQ